MNEFDSQRAARVWQRVQGERQEQPAPQGANFSALMMDQWQVSAQYLQLSRQLSGKEAAILLRLARESRAQAMCLKGISILSTGQAPMLRAVAVQPAPAEGLLRRCYGLEIRSLKAYENHRADTEYGSVFENLAQQKREHCCLLLELIGELGKK